MTDQVVDVSAGAIEYTYPRTITETAGKNISAARVTVSLGSYTAPGTWVTPDVVTHPTTSAATVQVLISSALGLTVGRSYFLWTAVSDSPERVIRRTPGQITVV